ncbi:ricin-type beta-trefoil lectin domain protein, partial [Streptomyces sp. Ru72]|uniref:ricin-type beta-trefoil lectin domain protein n=1 Tax=Streptomyces sp. Ru72 TaxID=2080747 RepID=UPI000D48C796
RLTAAWTDTGGITDSSSAPVGAVGGCNSTSVQTTTTAPVKTTTVGGPAPYWQTYTYDLLGDRTGMVDHDTGGNALNDTTQTTAYTGTDGTATAALPNQSGTTTSSNPTTGTATWTPNYTDTGYTPNKNAGNTMSRKVLTTSPLISPLTTSTGKKLCVDDASSSTTDGNKIQIYTCNGTNAQNWTVGTDGTIRGIGGKCLDVTSSGTTNGTKIDLYTCNGTGAQQWKAAANGSLVNPQSGECLDDPSSSTTLGTQLQIWTCNGTAAQTWNPVDSGTKIPAGQTQTFTYDAEGRTATVTTPSGTTNNTSKYLYDADGNLLEQTSSTAGTDKTRILYLFGGTEQITLNVSAKTWTGLRYYSGPHGTTITRSSTGTVSYQVANLQGTATTAIDASSLAVTRRYYDPYGNPRGTKPTTWVAADENHGFLGKPTDATTGLDLLGARNYDPALGRFLTPDPIFEAGDPNQMGGYAYAGDNPASGSDPTGLALDGTGSGGNQSAYDDYCKYFPNSDMCGGGTDTSSGSSGGGSGDSSSGSSSGSPGNPYACGRFGDCGPTVNYKHDPAKIVVKVVVKVVIEPLWDVAKCEFWIGGGGAGHDQACDVAGGVISGGGLEGSGAGAVGGAVDGDAGGALQGTADGDAAAAAGAGPDAVNEAVDDEADIIAAKKANAQEHAKEADAQAARPSGPGVGEEGTKPAGTCSFSPDTRVLMKGGGTKPIGKIKVGDKVEAADPRTGKHDGSHTVTATLTHRDDDLLDVTVRAADGRTATLHTTSEHPFWDETAHAWVPAGKLLAHHALVTEDGHEVRIAAVRTTPGAARRYNLTVAHVHTYYVMAGTAAVLVHNHCGNEPQGRSPKAGDTVVLGVRKPGNALAKQIKGGMTFNHEDYGYYHGGSTPQWVDEVNNALKDDRINIAVELHGVLGPDGAGMTPSELFAEAYRRGVANGWQGGPGTQWEMSRVGYYVYAGWRDWGDIDFYLNGEAIPAEEFPKPDWEGLRASAGQ